MISSMKRQKLTGQARQQVEPDMGIFPKWRFIFLGSCNGYTYCPGFNILYTYLYNIMEKYQLFLIPKVELVIIGLWVIGYVGTWLLAGAMLINSITIPLIIIGYVIYKIFQAFK